MEILQNGAPPQPAPLKVIELPSGLRCELLRKPTARDLINAYQRMRADEMGNIAATTCALASILCAFDGERLVYEAVCETIAPIDVQALIPEVMGMGGLPSPAPLRDSSSSVSQ